MEKLSAAIFGMKYMHLHAYYPNYHFSLRKLLNLINMPTVIKEKADRSKLLGILSLLNSTQPVGEID